MSWIGKSVTIVRANSLRTSESSASDARSAATAAWLSRDRISMTDGATRETTSRVSYGEVRSAGATGITIVTRQRVQLPNSVRPAAIAIAA